MGNIYDNMSKEELIAQCVDKDNEIDTYIEQINQHQVLTKNDIMRMYKCESNKALRILKLMFQMGYGNKIGKVPAISWFTNLEHNKRNEELLLYKKYYDNPTLYPKYDNYDAIEVSKVKDIPCDYYGVMGVPITFMDKFKAEHANKDWLDKVFFEGRVDQDILLSAYSSCDIFVAPSRFESFGLIFLEAMRESKPVLIWG